MTEKNRHRRGILLMELIAVLLVLAAVLLVTAKIAASATQAARDASKMEAVVSKLDAVLMSLRQDVWESAAMRAATDTSGKVTLELDQGDGRTIRWEFVPPAGPANDRPPESFTIMRTSPGGLLMQWQGLPEMSIQAHGPLLNLQVVGVKRYPTPGAGSRAEAAEQMTLVSQRQLAAGAK
jgi:type II secretory pathway pseudopilin PulG